MISSSHTMAQKISIGWGNSNAVFYMQRGICHGLAFTIGKHTCYHKLDGASRLPKEFRDAESHSKTAFDSKVIGALRHVAFA